MEGGCGLTECVTPGNDCSWPFTNQEKSERDQEVR
jgi:hypothetical protein